MKRTLKHFGASPGPLPQAVFDQIQSWLTCSGPSPLEINSRDECVVSCIESIRSQLRQFLSVPASHDILLLVGTARLLNSLIPMNILNSEEHADYFINGYWSNLSAQEAGRYSGHIHEQSEYFSCPSWIQTHPQSRYLHYCDNETADGIEFPTCPRSDKPLIADMSSNIGTRPLHWTQLGAVYGNTQKMFGATGLAFIIIREDWLHHPLPYCPAVYQFQKLHQHTSQVTTLPVLSLFIMEAFIRWLRDNSSLENTDMQCREKSHILYETIDQSKIYHCSHPLENRSRITLSFHLPDTRAEEAFLKEAAQQGFYGLAGHRHVGGIRVCLYPAVSLASVLELRQFLIDFERKYS